MKKIAVFLILVFFNTLDCLAQNDTTIYYSYTKGVVSKKRIADEYKQVVKVNDRQFDLLTYIKDNKGKWVRNKQYTIKFDSDTSYITINSEADVLDTLSRNTYHLVENGYFISSYQDRQLVEEGVSQTILPLIKQGVWTYYINGEKDHEIIHVMNEVTTNRYFAEDGEVIENVTYVATTPCSYKGGMMEMMPFIKANIMYPRESLVRKQQGKVLIRFIVTDEGKAKAFRIIKGVNDEINFEALRVVKMISENWEPAINEGKRVHQSVVIPIKFQL